MALHLNEPVSVEGHSQLERLEPVRVRETGSLHQERAIGYPMAKYILHLSPVQFPLTSLLCHP